MAHPADKLILAAAAKVGGFTNQPLAGCTEKAVYMRCLALAAEGKLHKAKISYRIVRWYDTAERAQAAVDKMHVDRLRTAKPEGAKLNQNLPVVVPAGVKVQHIPSGFKPRYEGLVGAVAFGLQRGRITR